MRFYYDFHIHSCLSPCASDDMTPPNIANMAYLAGLQVIAVCDHNSAKNCAAVIEASERVGITALPGMELMVDGDVHVLCLFESLRETDAFCELVYERLPDMKNKAEVYGNQIIADDYGNIKGYEERLLMTAANISIFDIYSLARSYGGIAIPAHIDRPAFSLLFNLGFYTPDMRFNLAEITTACDLDALRQTHPDIKDLSFLKNSDAHSLDTIYTALYTVEAKSRAPKDIINALLNMRE